MNIERFPEPIDALAFSDTFDEAELSQIMNEIHSFDDKLGDSGLWISDIYKDMDMSSINRANMKKFFDSNLVESMASVNSLYGIYGHVNNHNTRIKKYDVGQSSIMQYDSAAFTICTFVFDGDKNFSGGDITLQVGGDIAYEKYVENNMTVIFPSSYYFGISEISVNEGEEFSGLYTISSYLFIESR